MALERANWQIWADVVDYGPGIISALLIAFYVFTEQSFCFQKAKVHTSIL